MCRADEEDDSLRNVFLLPFNEVPKCSLSDPLRHVDAAIAETEKTLPGAIYFRSCQLRRTGNGPLEVGGKCANFTLTAGEHILLLPQDNSHRPGVAEIQFFWCTVKRPNSGDCFVRLKWYYRAEDLGDIPAESVGEDEVFITNHFDDCNAEAIAGRCSVTPYVEWLNRTLETAPKRGNGCQASDASDANDDEMSDTYSSFCDNYASSSVTYYYRRLFDTSSNSFQPCDSGIWKVDSEDQGDADDYDDEIMDETRKRRSNLRQTRHVPEARQCRAAHFLLPHKLALPEVIECRDSQKEYIRNFLQLSIIKDAGVEKSSRCLYISGVPGTGKTASVREVVQDFRQRQWKGMSLEFVEINAMGLADTNMLYSSLYQALAGGKALSPMQCAHQLNKYFSEGTMQKVALPRAHRLDRRIVLILDEMDVLVNRSEKVLYTVLDWSASSKIPFALICISNTMNLPEKMLPRISSRLGVNRLSFPPYSSTELKIILTSYVDSENDIKYDAGAISLCAAKVGAVSGDVRRAIQILRHAAEIAVSHAGKDKIVNAETINRAVEEMSDGGKLQSINQTCIYERLILLSSVLIRRTGSAETMNSLLLSDVFDQAKKQATVLNIGIPTENDLEEACWSLEMRNIITLEKPRSIVQSRIYSNIRDDDIAFALQSCDMAKRILQT